MLNYQRYKRVPVVNMLEREWPNRESACLVQCRFKRWKSGFGRAYGGRRED